MNDEELAALIHEVAQETMKALELSFQEACIMKGDGRYFFAANAVKNRREASEEVWANRQKDLTGTPLFEVDSNQNENQN